MRHPKHSYGVKVQNFQHRQSRAVHVLLLKIVIICVAAGVTIHYSGSVIVGVIASTVAGCAVEAIDAYFEKHNDKRLERIEQELNKLRRG